MVGLLQCTVQVIVKSIRRTFNYIMKSKSIFKYSRLPTHEGHFKASTVTWLQLCQLTGFKVLECFLCLGRCGCLTWLLKKLDRSLEKRRPLDEAIEIGHVDISRYISDIEDRDSEIERLRKDNDKLIVHNRTLEKDKKRLSDLNRNLQGKNLAQENTRLQEENQVLIQENKRLKNENLVLAQENTRLQEENQVLAQENTRLQEENQVLIQENNRLQERNQVLAQENTRLQEGNQVLIQENKRLKNENLVLAQENTRLQEENQVLAQENTRLQEGNQVLIQENKRLKNENLVLAQENMRLQEENQVLAQENTKLQEENQVLIQENKRLKNENLVLAHEKDDAMTRLSAMMSEKLRDNNPNLNDQFRPTKLAEMFSELYDYEWTDAYTALEKLSSHEDIVQCLLDILMESYSFCGAEMDRNWELVCDWFYDQNLPNIEALRTSLKDARKQKVRQKAKDMEERYLGSLKQLYPVGSVTHTALQVPAMQTYITQTVVLCLYMATTDPPVVLGCPGWQSMPNREEVARTSSHERSPFNKHMFKEYTERGPYLEYVVWPAMFLYKDGPLLAKGVAQGTKSQLP